VTAKANLLVVLNGIALVSATVYVLVWLSMLLGTITRSLRANELTLPALVVILMVLVLVSAIHLAVRLKLRILREVKDPDLPMVRPIYKSASRLNLLAYLVFYPLMFGLVGNARQATSGSLLLFVLLACVTALPLWARARSRSEAYESVKAHYGLGRHLCGTCQVSLAFPRRTRRWTCYRCGRLYG